MFRSALHCAATLAGLVSMTACFVSADPEPAPAQTVVVNPAEPTSQVVVHWTITEGTDPSECQKSVAATFVMTIIDADGGSAGTFQQSCNAFATSVTLPSGAYSGVARLVDGAGQPRTTDVSISAFALQGGETLDVAVDFPSDSFR